ncbi:MAG TPA: ATP synthase subunit I [Burkholderiaceae bacterium]|nr:ATP synthase subunit I [Burkholderiaceae bacterium]
MHTSRFGARVLGITGSLRVITYNPAALPQTNRCPSMSAPQTHGARAELDDEYADGADEPPFRSLTRDEAQALRVQHPPLSPWRVVAVQAAAGLASAALWWGVSRKGEAAWSALYGAAAVVVPNALMARGLARQLASGNPGAAVFGFMFWEAVKVAVAVAMLVAAAKVVPGLSWPALLVTMIVCLKVNWLALLWWGRVKNKSLARQPLTRTNDGS